MLRANKILFLIFGILILIAFAEVISFFFITPHPSTHQTGTVQITRLSPKPGTGEQTVVEDTISQSNLEPINLSTKLVLDSPRKTKLVDAMLVADNSDNDEWMGFGLKEPIFIPTPFRIKLKFKREGEGNIAQVVLRGKTLVNSQYWWQGVHEISLMGKKGHSDLHIEIRDGTSEKAGLAFSVPKIETNEPFYIEFLDSSGKQFILVDKEGSILRKVDVTKVEGLSLPNGLFPEKKMRVKVDLSPKAKIKVEEFVLSFIGDY